MKPETSFAIAFLGEKFKDDYYAGRFSEGDSTAPTKLIEFVELFNKNLSEVMGRVHRGETRNTTRSTVETAAMRDRLEIWQQVGYEPKCRAHAAGIRRGLWSSEVLSGYVRLCAEADVPIDYMNRLLMLGVTAEDTVKAHRAGVPSEYLQHLYA